MNWPRTISKKDLAIMLDYYAPKSGRIYYNKLYTLIFNDALLNKLKIPRKRLRNVKKFNFDNTQLLLEHLDVTMDEIQKIIDYKAKYLKCT